MFKPEHGTQDSLVCQLCCNKENKTSAETVAQRFFCRKPASKNRKFIRKKMCQSLFLTKLWGVKFCFPFS